SPRFASGYEKIQLPVPWRNQQTRPPQERLILRDPWRCESSRNHQIGPVVQLADTSVSETDAFGMEVQLLPGPPTILREGRRSRLACLISTQAPCNSESRIQYSVRFFQQQDASLTSRRWGCNSLTGHQRENHE